MPSARRDYTQADMLQIAGAYRDACCWWHVGGEELREELFVWRYDSTFPLAELERVKNFTVPKDETWADWLESERQENPDYFARMTEWVRRGGVEEEPIVISHTPHQLLKEPLPVEIWDGWHRIAISLVLGFKTIPAIVGDWKAT